MVWPLRDAGESIPGQIPPLLTDFGTSSGSSLGSISHNSMKRMAIGKPGTIAARSIHAMNHREVSG